MIHPYSKGQKNDFRDAEAIAEAVQRPTMKFVATKTADQLDLEALHRVRERLVSQRTGIINQIRAFLLERGIAVRQGQRFPARRVAAHPGHATRCPVASHVAHDRRSGRRLAPARRAGREFVERDRSHRAAGCRLRAADERTRYWPIISSAMVAAIGAGDVFTKGRDGWGSFPSRYRPATASSS